VIRILIADDHPVVREGLAAILNTQPDFAVVGEAADGEELLARAAELHPDLVLVDLAMPGLDGAAAISRLPTVAPTTRALVLTAFDSDERIIGALQVGARGYVLKGAPRAQIFAAVRAVAAGESLLQPTVATRLMARIARPAAPTLSPREREVLALVARGRTNQEIAGALGIVERTVKFHLSGALRRLGAANRTEAVTLAAQHGLIEL
jgi:DNA-binding NarL/FixJ family response regulator